MNGLFRTSGDYSMSREKHHEKSAKGLTTSKFREKIEKGFNLKLL